MPSVHNDLSVVFGLDFDARFEYFVEVFNSDLPFVGAWRSLVAHLLWEQGVGGSNPLAPTNEFTHLAHATLGGNHDL
jgi:hypothetical protein